MLIAFPSLSKHNFWLIFKILQYTDKWKVLNIAVSRKYHVVLLDHIFYDPSCVGVPARGGKHSRTGEAQVVPIPNPEI